MKLVQTTESVEHPSSAAVSSTVDQDVARGLGAESAIAVGQE